MKRLIISTSTSCLDYLDKPDNVKILPMNIHIGDKDYLDGQEITIDELSQHMIRNPDIPPSTSAPSQQQLINFFEDLANDGVKEVLVITVSEKASLTAANIRKMRDMFIGRIAIHVFNSRIVSHGEALLVHEASRMINENALMSEITSHLNKVRDKMHMYLTVDKLDSMIRTKRLSAFAGFFANLFNIKPLVIFDIKGQFTAHALIRSFERSLMRLAEIADKHARNQSGQIYILANTKNPYLFELHNMLAKMGHKNIQTFPFASVSIANIGVHAIGILFVEN